MICEKDHRHQFQTATHTSNDETNLEAWPAVAGAGSGSPVVEGKGVLGQVSVSAVQVVQVARCHLAGQEVLPVVDGAELLKQEGEEQLIGALGVHAGILLRCLACKI